MNKKDRILVPPGLSYIADNIIQKQNMLGISKERKALWAKGLDITKSSHTVFFAGCGYQYTSELHTLMSIIKSVDKSVINIDSAIRFAGIQKKMGIDITGAFTDLIARDKDSGSKVLKNVIMVLRKVGVEFGYLAEEEPCCGGLIFYTGLEKEFAQNANMFYKKVKSSGIKKLIGIVPSCTYTIRKLIPRYVEGFDLEVKHFIEVVIENMNAIKLEFPSEAKVTYHDPCQLSRYLGLVEEPRRIIRSIRGIQLVETSWTNREWSTCCGGGGGFEAVFPELSEILAINRTRELLETGAQIIVTHCPGCIMQIRSGLERLKVKDVEVLDLAQLIALSIRD